MISNNKHIINKVFIEVNTDSREKAYYFKDNIDMLIKEYVIPRLVTCFNDLGEQHPDHYTQLERLDIELTVQPDDEFIELQQSITNQVKKRINQLQTENLYKNESKRTLRRIQDEDKNIEKLIHFLEKGINVWWDSSEKIINLKEKETIVSSRSFTTKISRVLLKPLPRRRFLNQFTDQEIQLVLDAIVKYENQAKASILKPGAVVKMISKGIRGIKQFSQKEKILIWDAVFNAVLNKDREISQEKIHLLKLTKLFSSIVQCKTEQEEVLVKNYMLNRLKIVNPLLILLEIEKETNHILGILNDHKDEEIRSKDRLSNGVEKDNDSISQENNTDTIKNNISENELFDTLLPVQRGENFKGDNDFEETISIEQDSEDLYISNAGLILVHPFLNQLFKSCELLNNEGEFIDKEKVVHLLHYIATGKEQQMENHMILEKFLCNLPLQYPIDRFVQLEEQVKNHAEEMLTALIGHWSAMKNSSNDLLRNEFLQRSGKLVLTEDRPRIILERKTHDILLDKIPWNISMIKLPWKHQIIFVDW